MKNQTTKSRVTPKARTQVLKTRTNQTSKPIRKYPEVVTPALGVKKLVAGAGKKLMAKELMRHSEFLKKTGGIRKNLSMGRAADAARRLARKLAP